MRFALAGLLFVSICLGQPDTLAQKSATAKQLMADGKFSQAVAIYAELVAVVPGNAGLLLNLGMARHMAGQDREAIADLARVLKLQPNAYPALAMTGTSYMRLGEPQHAVPALRKALAQQPGDNQLRQMLADAYLMVDKPAEASAELRKLPRADQANPRLWYALGRSYETLAQQSFNELEKTAPGSGFSLALLAETRLKAGQSSAAFYFYKQALAKNPDIRGLHSGIAEVYRITGHPQWAATEAQKDAAPCAGVKPDCLFAAGKYLEAASGPSANPQALYWRTRAYNTLALEAFSQLARLPPSPEHHRIRAEVATSQRRYADSITELKKAQELAPGDLDIDIEIARNTYLTRDYVAAELLLRAALAKDPGSADLHFLLGDTLVNLQRLEEAEPHLQKASTLLPARAALGRVLMQLNQPGKAIPHLEAALAIDDDGATLYQLARAEQMAGNIEQAKQLMSKYQDQQRAQSAAKELLQKEAIITAP